MTRREILQTSLAGLAALPVASQAAQAAEARKPNVIVIITDDQGSVDAGCYGSKDLLTPNLDALAARGVRFTQFYSAAPVCSPSRAALLTGRYPLHTGLLGNASSQRGANGGLPPQETTMPAMFKAAGYATAHIGKWHLGYTPQTMPNARGFDYSFGHMGGCIDSWSHFYYWSGPNVHDLYRNGKEIYASGRFFADMMVEEAGKFITDNRERPFFMYFAINEPHYPYQPDDKWREQFKNLPYPRNLFAAFMATLDERIGQLLKKLDEHGLRDNTIILFQSDHGHSTEERAHFGGGSAGPYRGAKFSLFEGGIRVPGMISWPGHLPQGQVRDQLVHSCDWLPTVAELCGLTPPPSLDGASMLPVINAPDAPSKHGVVHWQVDTGKPAQWAVRDGDWKLIGNAWDTSAGDKNQDRIERFLCNLRDDIGEKKNLAAEKPEIVARLTKLHEEWAGRL